MATSAITTKVKGYEMEIEFSYHKASRGARERGTGLQLEPDEPAGVDEITALRLRDPADFLEIVSEEVTISMEDVIEAIERYREEDDPT